MPTETHLLALLRKVDETLEDQFGGWWIDAPSTDTLGQLRDEIRGAVQICRPKGGEGEEACVTNVGGVARYVRAVRPGAMCESNREWIASTLEAQTARITTLEAALAERDGEVESVRRRFAWLLDKCGGWTMSVVHNKWTGFFISRSRSAGFCGGEERWDDERIAWAPPSESFDSAVDRAIAGEDPEAEMIADIRNRRRKKERSPPTPAEQPDEGGR